MKTKKNIDEFVEDLDRDMAHVFSRMHGDSVSPKIETLTGALVNIESNESLLPETDPAEFVWNEEDSKKIQAFTGENGEVDGRSLYGVLKINRLSISLVFRFRDNDSKFRVINSPNIANLNLESAIMLDEVFGGNWSVSLFERDHLKYSPGNMPFSVRNVTEMLEWLEANSPKRFHYGVKPENA